MDNPVYIPFQREPGQHYEFRAQPNGDIYVYHRPSHWSRSKKRMVFDKSTLLGAAVPGDSSKLRLIGKRRKEALAASEANKSPEEQPDIVAATEFRVGAMAITDHVFRVSHVDEQVRASLASVDPTGVTTDKVLTMMRCMFINQSAILDTLETDQLEYKFPYDKGLSETDVGRLYELVGSNPKVKYIFFNKRAIVTCGVT